MSLRPRPGAATAAFLTVPDVKEHEELSKRVTVVEGAVSSLKQLEKNLASHLKSYPDLVARVAAVEFQNRQLTTDLKTLTEETRSHERADLRGQQQITNLQSEVDRLRTRLARHERVLNDRGKSSEPQGFQENDAPRVFMGGGR